MIRSDLQLTNKMMNASSNLPLNAVNISNSSNNNDIKLQQQQQQAQQAVGNDVGVNNNVTTTFIAKTTTATSSNTAASSINNNNNHNDNSNDGAATAGHDITQQTNKSTPRSNAWPTLMSGNSSDRRDGNHQTQSFHKANNEHFRHRTSSLSHGQEQLSKTNLYIRGLQTTTKDQDLNDMCNRFGQISSSKAILDKNTGLCRGYGFVEFASVKSAEIAVRELTKSGIQAQMAKITSSHLSHNNVSNQIQSNNNNNNNNSYNTKNNSNNQLNNYNNQKSTSKNGGYNNSNSTHHISSGGQQLNHNSSNHSSSQKNHADPTNLYIANLPINMSEPELEELLSDYGNIVSTRILRDESNYPRGVGFARMESRDKCEEIIEQLNGRTYKGSSEPLVVKFADGGNKKRHHYNNNHHHHHNNNNSNHHNHLVHHKVANQDEIRWQDNSTNPKDVSAIPSYEHHQHGEMSHSNQTPDLAMMSAMRLQPGYPPSVTTGGAYPTPLGPPSSTPQWIHPAGGQPYVVPPQMTQTGGLSPSGQAAAAAAAAAMHYGPHIPHLAAQMQSLQLAHGPPAHLGGYLPPQHHWPTLWPHPIPQQSPSPMGRLSAGPGPTLQTGPAPMPGQQHLPQLASMHHQPSQIRQPQPQRLMGQQATMMDSNKLHVSVPL